jgi:hypothetical protein
MFAANSGDQQVNSFVYMLSRTARWIDIDDVSLRLVGCLCEVMTSFRDRLLLLW